MISELDPEHWLYDNIVFAMWPSDGEGGKHHDVAQGKEYDSSGTVSAGNRGIDENGEHLKFTPSSVLSSAHYINLGRPPEVAVIDPEFTLLVGYKRTDDQDSGYGRLVAKSSGSTSDMWGLAQETQAAGSNLRWRVNHGGGGVTNIYSTTSMAIGEYHDIAATINDRTGVNTLKLFVDGVQEASDTGVDLDFPDYDTYIGSLGTSDTRNLHGDIYYVIILNRELSADEISLFTENVDSIRKQNVIDFRKITIDTGIINLIINDSLHSLSSDNVDITQDHNLSIDNSNHAQTSDNVDITQDHNLSIDDSNHDHISDNVALSQLHILAIQDAVHSHISSELLLTQNHNLVIQDSIHSHISDEIVLSVGGALDIQDSNHAFISDNISLTQDHNLIINNAVHALSSEEVILSLDNTLIINNSVHSVISNLINLTQAQQLVIQDALHDHISSDVNLTQDHILIINDSLHDLISDNVVFGEIVYPDTPDHRIIAVNAENRVYVVAYDDRIYHITKEVRIYPVQ